MVECWNGRGNPALSLTPHVPIYAGMLNSAYDTVTNTANSAVSGSAKLVQNAANYVGETAEKYTKK
jgi:hypothetical protein